MDLSNGYEGIAADFIKGRGQAVGGIGALAVRRWAQLLPPRATVLDLGCGTGIPITQVLLEAGLKVYAVDASPTLVSTFRQNFPGVPVVCEAAEQSAFFHRQFDAALAVGLLFLLPEAAQAALVGNVAEALRPGGRFLFTAPAQPLTWLDAMTGQRSASLGAATYSAWLAAAGLSLMEEFSDEGQNHYYHAHKS